MSSPDAIRRALSGLQIGVLRRDDGPDLGMPTRASTEARKIYRCLGLTWNQTLFSIRKKGKPGNDRP